MMILLLCILLYSVSSLNIRIDGDNGIDSNECLTEQPQSSCQSLKYVADTINNTGNLTIEIISPTLSLQGSVIFTDINGLTINGQGTIISCSNGSMLYGNSGIVVNNCSNAALIGFTIKHCGLLYKNNRYYGHQSVLFYNCRKFNISKVNFFDNNGYGLVLYDNSGGSVSQNVFENNGIKHSRADKSYVTGGGLYVLQYTPYYRSISTNTIEIANNQFINNSATTIGGALYVEVDYCANLLSYITVSNFIGNRAGTAGGAIGFKIHKIDYIYNGTITFAFRSFLSNCNIINNKAKFGGGVAIQLAHYDSKHDITDEKEFLFIFCNFTGNQALVSSAVDINGRSQKVYQCLKTVIKFQYCYFTENIAGIDNNQQELRGKLFKATLYATDAFVYLVTEISFANNTGTALYAVNSRVHISHHASIRFFNNTGDQGGAIFLADDSAIDFVGPNEEPLINISNNKALVGGGIYIRSLINLHEGTCFFFQSQNVRFQFSNNNATSGFGHDIFASTLQDCIQLYGGNVSTIFTPSKMGKFEFSSRTPPPVATAPVNLSINEKELVPYPGIPYNVTITQKDEFDNNVTNLQLFPLSATLQNVHKSSLKIDIAYSIADSFIIVFKGTVGDNATLLLQTTEYSARKLINIRLYHCPPGYMFQIDTCQCNSNYYYGISGRLEDYAAVIDGGLWAGYIGDKFATADSIGGGLRLEVDHCANLFLFIATSNFIGNTAGTSGGAIGIILHKVHC
uniref:Right handed beta helix domain-containing protein n=1 Tax=Amphimedon queenslandica TaxID=400682 RepID=A0A1X7T551_AMPQE